MRVNHDAVSFVKAFVSSGKPVAAICHGPWTPLEADAVRGRRMTSWPSPQSDLRNGGADWVDEEVVVDGQLTTSRKPADLPAFCAAIVEQYAPASGIIAIGRSFLVIARTGQKQEFRCLGGSTDVPGGEADPPETVTGNYCDLL